MATETYELRVEGINLSEYDECVMHFQSDNVTADATLTNGQSLIDSWHNNILTLWLAVLPSTYAVTRLAARRAHPKPSAVAHRQYQPADHVGTLGGQSTSDNLCPSVFLIPPLGVKSGGKVFLPCIGQGEITNNVFDAGYITAVAALFNAMIANFGTSGVHWHMAIFSRKNLVANLVSGFQLTPRLGFQGNRRKPI